VDKGTIDVPAALLLDPEPTAATKVLWMALRLHPGACPTQLEALTGLSHPTIASLTGTAARLRPPVGPRVRVPSLLLAEPTVGARAKVLYGLLQATPGFWGHGGRFTYPGLAAATGLSPNTLKPAAADLVNAGWLRLEQKTWLSPIRFTLGSPAWRRSLASAAAARRRLKRGKFKGEALMQEYLSLLVGSTQFTDNARPGFLESPVSGERLELDRFYPLHKVAVEFNGTQHDEETEQYSRELVDAQRLRDVIKAGLCVYQGIHLVIIHTADLSLQGILAKIGGWLPLRDLAGHEPLIDLLEEASIGYIANAKGAR
jgi:hypothetical protein